MSIKLTTQLRVRYQETDQMGVVYYANYLTWFEMARTEFCRELGRPYHDWEKEGIFLPVAESYCRYKHPARYDDHILISTSIRAIERCSLTFSYIVTRQADGKLVAEGWTKHAMINREGKLIKGANPFLDWVKDQVSDHVEVD